MSYIVILRINRIEIEREFTVVFNIWSMWAIKNIFCTGICECFCHTHPYVHFCMIMIWIRQELMEMTTRRCHLGLLGYVSGTWCPKSSEENSYSSQNTSDIRPDYVANIRTANRLHTQVSVFCLLSGNF